MSGIRDYKITDTTGHKVADVPGDTLTGTVAQNKAVFDNLGELIIEKLNGMADYLYLQGIDVGISQIGMNLYPVGSIYLSVNHLELATLTALFGGTWEQLKDRFLLTAGDTYSGGDTGGSADAVLPAHTHSISAYSMEGTTAQAGSHSHKYRKIMNIGKQHCTSSSGVNNTVTDVVYSDQETTTSAGSHTHTFQVNSPANTTESAGVSNTGKNMPPYLVVYAWKRIA